jgi:hypothetical protein
MQIFGSHPASSTPLRRLVTVAVSLVASITTLLAMPTLASALSTANLTLISWHSGAFSGAGPGPDKTFGNWRGLSPAVGTDYLPEGTWSGMDNPTTTIQQWSATPNITPLLGVPMWPKTGGPYSLAQAATGAYNSYFTVLAQNLVAGGLSHAILRLAWEADGTWYPWSIGGEQQALQYAQAWRQIVGAIEQVPGQHFGFDWCMNLVPVSGWSPADAYPGDQYVTEIGEDVYDGNQPGVRNQSPADRWNYIVNSKYGLAWQASFAAQHGKPISFPEWALAADPLDPTHFGGDDPTFIQNMHDWFMTHNTAVEDYFNYDNPVDSRFYGIDTSTSSTYFPNARALYQKLF